MEKIAFDFSGFTVTTKVNNKYDLIVWAKNDITASYLYPDLTASTNISVKYNLLNRDYFDLIIILNDFNSYYEINVYVDDKTKLLAYAIDNETLTNLWVGYYVGSDSKIWGTAIPIHN